MEPHPVWRLRQRSKGSEIFVLKPRFEKLKQTVEKMQQPEARHRDKKEKVAWRKGKRKKGKQKTENRRRRRKKTAFNCKSLTMVRVWGGLEAGEALSFSFFFVFFAKESLHNQ